ncbi:aquaporin [Mycoplasmopsis alligatoris]|uniref:Transporter, major intrinsic protein (MIP) family protein n=1 Tax=Mycoplasmopsis alligatoris A21JP2 TaxID=747682 RepID=D4XVU2_9BACT|nr:aquaporin [Mycoplasmopsis alligatoris]EFF41533.1 hypothetical protein MALL_0695 [Mycoplasmopsis alligatoris A21JP2]
MKNETMNNETKLQKLFGFFKLTKEKRHHVQQPKDTKTWLKHAFSELIGTIFISLGLAGLSLNVGTTQIEHIFLLHNIIVGFFAGFIVVGLCLAIFLRWSCDLNPAVSITRYLNGTNTGKYTSMKISMQIIGCIIAGAIIFGIGKMTSGSEFPNSPIMALNSAKKAFGNVVPNNTDSLLAAGGTWIFFIEMVMTSVLLFPIFSPNIKDKYRDVLIMFVISLSVWMGILGGTAAINPARGLAQQTPALFYLFNGDIASNDTIRSLLIATFTMILGGLVAPFFFLFCQGFTRAYFNPFMVYVIKFKNYRNDNMSFPNQK